MALSRPEFSPLVSHRRMCCLALIWLGLAASGALANDEMETRALDAVVRIDADQKFGAGIVLRRVGDGLAVVTAAHVVEGARSIRVELRAFPGLWMNAKALEHFMDREADVAVVRVQLAPEALSYTPPAELPTRVLEKGAISSYGLRLVGQPSFEGWVVSPIVDLQRANDEVVRVHHRCDDGMSGGAVYDTFWHIVGMTQRRFTSQICEAIALPKLVEILDRWGVGTSWLAAGDGSGDRGTPEPESAVSIDVRPLSTRSVRSLRGAAAFLSAEQVASTLSGALPGAGDPPIRFAVGVAGTVHLELEVVTYDVRRVDTATYGVTVRTDIFTAAFRAVLRSTNGRQIWTRSYPPVEVADHEGVHGWAETDRPPLAELLAQIAPEMVADLTQPDVIMSLDSGGPS